MNALTAARLTACTDDVVDILREAVRYNDPVAEVRQRIEHRIKQLLDTVNSPHADTVVNLVSQALTEQEKRALTLRLQAARRTRY